MWLRQSTAVNIVIGPMVDQTDGFTAETALTMAQADVRLSKNGGAYAQKNDANAASHMENGNYSCALNATDTNTLGILTVSVAEAGALLFRRDYMVVAQQVWDSFFGADLLQVDARELNGVAAAASNLSQAAQCIVPFTVETAGFSPTQTQFECNLNEATTNHYNDRVVEWRTGALAGQIAQVQSHTLQGGRVRFTVTTMTEAPANGDTGVLL